MKWDEFRALLTGISPDTALGRVVSIRAENDKEILKHFTPDQKRIRSEWRNRRARNMPVQNVEAMMSALEKAFADMAGYKMEELKD